MAKAVRGVLWIVPVAIGAVVVVLFWAWVFLFRLFDTPSNAMAPTLFAGDRFVVSKYAYGYSRYSMSGLALPFSGRIFGMDPKPGDIAVFRVVKKAEADFVKRVIGLPGDRIQMKSGVLYINDQPIKRELASDFVGDGMCGPSADVQVKRWKETLPNGVSYQTLDCVDNGYLDNTNVYTVPPGHFFALGDNRDNSVDSRMLSDMGYIPFDNLIGRVAWIYDSHAPTN